MGSRSQSDEIATVDWNTLAKWARWPGGPKKRAVLIFSVQRPDYPRPDTNARISPVSLLDRSLRIYIKTCIRPK
jgi:hypothetical protein